MTIGTAGNRVSFNCDGVTKVFPIPLQAYLASDFEIVLTNSIGGEATLVLNNDYAVVASSTDQPPKWTLTTLAAVAYPVGSVLQAIVSPSQVQQTQYVQGRQFPSLAVQANFDRLTQMVQRLQDQVGRTVLAPDGDVSPVLGLPAALMRANTYLTFDANGNLSTSQTLPPGTTLSLATITALTGAQTPAEAAALVTPTFKQYAELDARRYAVDTTGATSTNAAFASLIAVAQQYTSVTLRMPQSGKYRFDTGITWDVSKVAIDWQGATLDFSHMAAGHAIAPTNSQANANIRALQPKCHPMENAYLIGPGVTVTGVDCIFLNDAVNANGMANLSFSRLAFQDFATDVTFGANAFGCTFFDCASTQLTGTGTTYSVLQQNATNSGERNSFISCIWFNKQLLVSNVSTSGGDVAFIDCSFDYFTRAFNITGGSNIFVIGGHMESNTDSDNWGFVSGGSSSLIIQNLEISMTGNKTAFDMFWSDATTTNGGVFLRDCVYGPGANTMTKHIVGGAGNARVENLITGSGGVHPTLAASLNVLAYGGFEQSAYANDWTFSGTTPPVRSNAQAHTGTWSLSVPFTAGNTNTQGVALRACKPGQYAQGEFWYLTPGIGGSGYQLVVQIDYLDAAGAVIFSTVVLNQTTSLAVWTRQGIATLAPAPTGTVSARLLVAGFGNGAGTQTGFVDDIILNTQ